MSDGEMTLDKFLAGISSDSDTDDDTDNEPESIVKKKDTVTDDYGSISYQIKELLKSNADAIHKVVDCVVYTYDPDTSAFYDPKTYQDMGRLDSMGDPIWEDDESEEHHNELKEKYNQNIKNKAGKFSECY